jgi:beta-lactam-binding protein with PASTA domain/predicted Ser/Thr protein kinase
MDQETQGGGGARVGGRYELGDLLGRGGMADVRRGTDVRLGRTVAIKRLRVDLASDPTFQARFRREAQSVAGLNHPNIVAVYDSGEEMAADGTHVQPYIVMEYVPGRTLREVLDDGRKLLPERVLEIITGVLAALDYSHRAGIIHRDIKPANVMLTPAGDVKVMDFGIARAITEGTSSVTQTQAVVGTAQYLSPEQARGETVDSRSDVYSAGCLLYELLVGRPPFVGDSPFSVAYQHVRETPEPPSTHDPELPAQLDSIVMKSLAKRVEDRYQSAADMQTDVQRYLDGQPVDAPTAVIAAAPAAPVPGEPTSLFQPVTDPEQEDERRKRWPIVLLALVLLALLVGGIVAAVQFFGSPDAEQVTVPQVTNMTERAAERRLENEGLQVGAVTQESSEDVEKGRVLEQDPEAGDTAESGSEVNLVISAGSEMVTVPDVLGQSERDATAQLTDAGLDVDAVEQDSDEPQGTVVDSNPRPATSVEAGSTVTIYVSTGPGQVPNVVGMTEDEAVAALEDAGFEADVQYDVDTPSERGTVLSQSPSGLTEAPRGSTVSITVSDYKEPEPSPTPSETATPTPTETATPTVTPSPTEDGGGQGSGQGNGQGNGQGLEDAPGQQ